MKRHRKRGAMVNKDRPVCPKCGSPDRAAHGDLYRWVCLDCRITFAGRLFQDGDPYVGAVEFGEIRRSVL